MCFPVQARLTVPQRSGLYGYKSLYLVWARTGSPTLLVTLSLPYSSLGWFAARLMCLERVAFLKVHTYIPHSLDNKYGVSPFQVLFKYLLPSRPGSLPLFGQMAIKEEKEDCGLQARWYAKIFAERNLRPSSKSCPILRMGLSSVLGRQAAL